MSHFERELPDNSWYRGLKIPHTVIRNIDEKTKLAVSGTGGTYAPSSPIVIGGAGMEFQGGALTLTGTALAQPGEDKNFIFGDDDFFRYPNAGRTVTVHDSPLMLLGRDNLQREARPWGATATVPTIRCKRANAHLIFPIRPPDGSYLISVTIGFRVGQSHADVPTNLPRARVVRIGTDGVLQKMPNAVSAVAPDTDGFVSPTTPVSGAAWYNGGAIQTLAITFDYPSGFHSISDYYEAIDTSTYGYAVEWYDEWGTNAYADDVGTYLAYFAVSAQCFDMRPY